MNFLILSENTVQEIIKVQCEHGNDSQLTTNLITISVALIAAVIAIYQVKANIISNSRVNWIENLREAISSYCVEISDCGLILTNMHDACKDKTGEELKEAIKLHYDDYQNVSNRADKLGNKVILYLNSKEKEHKKIEDLIVKISDDLHKKKMGSLDRDQLEEDLNEIIRLAKIIFKKEWKKSKRIFKI